MESPIFVSIPGAWHTLDTFDRLRSLMADQGLESIAIANHSVSAQPPNVAHPTSGLHLDIKHTKATLQKLVNHGREVVVVMHSYGGAVGASAMEGLGYARRSKAGLRGGVIMAVWMTAFVSRKGQSMLDLLGGNWEPWMRVLTLREQQKCIALLKPQPMVSFTEPALYEPWHDIPSMYLFCDKDLGIPLAVQEAFAERLGTPVTFHIDASHSPFLSQPGKVIEGIRLALKAGREQSVPAMGPLG
ncbi:alpha/beta hydrolase [Aspergillus foveolatus]|uniref:alpha/beta hydrolase n=1 Tax=Aspergillus foveolatus TaxID=210207 RepID=UPI003CCD86E3